MLNSPLVEVLVVVGAAVIAFGLIAASQPLLRRYALALPNSRSSHKKPTSQGGGIFVIAATIAAACFAHYWLPNSISTNGQLAWVMVATVGLALVGAIDDIRALEAAPRLVLQTVAVAAAIAALPSELRVISALPYWVERGLLLLGGVWFVNLVNFMDGIDWMTVAEVVPVSAGLAMVGSMGALPEDATFIALALCGAMVGFAPFNRPVAQLFLGDVGSLPIGLLLGWLLVLLAGNGHLAAALLLPLYYLADATVTLLRRVLNREQIMQAHRRHFYQRAMDGGFRVYQIVGYVFAVNLVLVGLAAATLMSPSLAIHVAALAAGSISVGIVLLEFNRVCPRA